MAPRPLARTLATLVLATAVALSASGCGARARVSRWTESRSLLGTAVSMTLWGEDERALAEAADTAFAAMGEVEDALDPYAPDSQVAEINEAPYAPHELPREATEILRRIEALGVDEYFSPTLWGVTRLYDFGGEGLVPDDVLLAASVEAARNAEFAGDYTGIVFDPAEGGPASNPGIDLSGASKGLALDRAVWVLKESPGVDAALISAGSSTAILGAKPDGEAWRVGIEDPRDVGSVIAVISVEATAGTVAAISTSGDYQQFFEKAGVRYHHILDPSTGRPAGGVRSMTVALVADTADSLAQTDADILSTALFVAGVENAANAAERLRVALYAVDDEGRVHMTPAPAQSPIGIESLREPTR